MMKQTVSIILTSYNHALWVRESIESVLAQTYPHWELIVLENGSTDRSPSIVEEYGTHEKVTVVRFERNMPHTVVSNIGIKLSKGQYISFLYSDDYYLPSKLERQVAEIETLDESYGVVYSAGYRLMKDGGMRPMPCGTYQGNILRELLTKPQFFQPIAPMVRRECLVRYPFNEQIFIEGEGIFVKIAMRYLFKAIQEPLVVMRDHENNMGKEIEPNLRRNLLMYENLFAHPEFPPGLSHLRGVVLGAIYRIFGWDSIRRERNYRNGREWLQMAIQHNPLLRRDARVRAGLMLSALPRPCANAGNHLLDMVRPACSPVSAPLTPVEGSEYGGHNQGCA